MSFKHGVTVSEERVVNRQVSNAINAVLAVGTSPIHLATEPKVNVPVVIKSLADARKYVGYSDDFSFTLNEVIKTFFELYNTGPIIVINTLDITNTASVSQTTLTVTNKVAKLEVSGFLKSSAVVKSAEGDTTYALGTDYTVDYDSAGNTIFTLKGSAASASSIKVNGNKVDPSVIVASNIIGTVVDDVATGLQLVDQVYPRTQLVPTPIIAPGFSHLPTVAAVMIAKSENINGVFRGRAITDLDATQRYGQIIAWKGTNNYTDDRQFNVYPSVMKAGKVYHLSTHAAAIATRLAAQNDGIPAISPSNQSLEVDGAIASSADLFLGKDKAEALNAEGITTALNFVGGWKLWGNRNGSFPADTSAKTSFFNVASMMDYIANSFILRFWSKVDSNINKVLVESIVDEANIWLNGLTAQGYLLGARLEFLQSDNPNTNLESGKLKFRLYATPASPGEHIEAVLEYDPQYLTAVFE